MHRLEVWLSNDGIMFRDTFFSRQGLRPEQILASKTCRMALYDLHRYCVRAIQGLKPVEDLIGTPTLLLSH
jgi:hypothetical protein